MSRTPTLSDLRREIDRIDDTILDLLEERTGIVERVRDLKKGEPIKIRAAREDAILYRLVGRLHGTFPKRELVRIWRELIMATLGFEGPFSVAVAVGDDMDGCWDLARDHFGSFTPMVACPSARRVIEAVWSQGATAGVVPLPRRDDPDPWWRHLASRDSAAPKVIARLPFAGPGNARGEPKEALAICPVGRESTGRDRSLFALEAAGEWSLAHFEMALAKAGLAATFSAVWRDPEAPGRGLFCAEVEGFLDAGDARLGRLADAFEASADAVLPLGAYGTPFASEELETSAADRPEPLASRRTPS